jgi:hypothetical protein
MWLSRKPGEWIDGAGGFRGEEQRVQFGLGHGWVRRWLLAFSLKVSEK